MRVPLASPPLGWNMRNTPQWHREPDPAAPDWRGFDVELPRVLASTSYSSRSGATVPPRGASGSGHQRPSDVPLSLNRTKRWRRVDDPPCGDTCQRSAAGRSRADRAGLRGQPEGRRRDPRRLDRARRRGPLLRYRTRSVLARAAHRRRASGGGRASRRRARDALSPSRTMPGTTTGSSAGTGACRRAASRSTCRTRPWRRSRRRSRRCSSGTIPTR